MGRSHATELPPLYLNPGVKFKSSPRCNPWLEVEGSRSNSGVEVNPSMQKSLLFAFNKNEFFTRFASFFSNYHNRGRSAYVEQILNSRLFDSFTEEDSTLTILIRYLRYQFRISCLRPFLKQREEAKSIREYKGGQASYPDQRGLLSSFSSDYYAST